jgi:hypothetical protein
MQNTEIICQQTEANGHWSLDEISSAGQVLCGRHGTYKAHIMMTIKERKIIYLPPIKSVYGNLT